MATNGRPGLDIPFARGLRQDLEADLMPPGGLLSALNVEFDKSARIGRRDGYAAVATTKFSKTKTYAGPARRFATAPSGEKLAFTDDTAFGYIPSELAMSEIGPGNGSMTVRASLVGTQKIGLDQSQQIYFSDVSVCNGFTVVAYTAYDTRYATTVCSVDVLDNATGLHVLFAEPVNLGAGTTVQPRVVTCGSIAFVFAPSATTNISWLRIDLSGASVTTATGTLVSDGTSGAQYFDVAQHLSTGFVIAYAANVAGNHHAVVSTYTNANPPVQTHTVNLTTNAANTVWSPSCMAVLGSRTVSDRLYAAGWNPASGGADTAVTILSAASDLSDPQKTGLTPGSTPPGGDATQMTLGRVATDRAILAFSSYGSTLADDARGHLYFAILYERLGTGFPPDVKYTDSGTAGRSIVANYTVGSKFFLDSTTSSVLSFGRFNDPSGAQSHLLLLDWGAGATIGTPQPVGHVASGLVPLFASNGKPGVGGLADAGSNRFILAIPINIGASQLSGQQVGLWTWQANGNDRFLSASANGALVVGGATPLAYDGQRLVELGFYSWPVVGATHATTATTGGTMTAGIYLYSFVYEWVDAAGARHQSPASPTVTVDMSASSTATNKVTWAIPNFHATRKHVIRFIPQTVTSIYDNRSPARIIMYRSVVGGPNMYRHRLSAAIDPSVESAIAIVDTAADATAGAGAVIAATGSLATGDLLYTQQGKLATFAPPPTIQPIVHARRLWGVDAENPERIWCTKTFESGEAPSYDPGLQVTIPGAGRITALAAQDGRLYALATTGIYLASYGDGPDNTGQGSFPEPTLVTTTANCTEPRSVVVGGDGIYFSGTSRWGVTIYMIPRGDGNPVDIGCHARGELQARPVVRGALDRFDRDRAEFLIVDSDTSPTSARILYYHHDLKDDDGIGAWTTAAYKSGNALHAIGTWGDPTVLSDATDASVALQTSGTAVDGTATAWTATIETGDVRPFGMFGYGSVDSVNLLATKRAAASLYLEASYDSGATYAESVNWSTSADTSSGPVLRRWEAPTKKLPNGSVRYRLSDVIPAGSTTTTASYWHGLMLEATPLGGAVRLPAAKEG